MQDLAVKMGGGVGIGGGRGRTSGRGFVGALSMRQERLRNDGTEREEQGGTGGSSHR